MGNDQQGDGFFTTEPSWMDFKVGVNPLRSDRHPEKFVTLRHVPIVRDSFKFYGVDDLKGFDGLPTWKMTTPHNIRRKTVQNTHCNACHGNSSLFLMNEDVKEEEKKANKGVMVGNDLIPKKIEREKTGKSSP
jgi:thiosulfate/3-mercaptopyruvate sulfurtransferase